MPFPTTRHTLQNVDSARGQGPRCDPRVHAQIHCLFWSSQSTQWQVHSRYLTQFRRGHVRGVPEKAVAPSLAQKEDGRDIGQRSVSPCEVAQATFEETPGPSRTPVSATVQSSTRAYRASLEAGPSIGDTQPVLRQPGRGAGRHRLLFRSMAATQFSAAKIMRHYLRRHV